MYFQHVWKGDGDEPGGTIQLQAPNAEIAETFLASLNRGKGRPEGYVLLPLECDTMSFEDGLDFVIEETGQVRRGCLTVGDIRRAIEGLPDYARVLPDWGDFEPGDSDPCVRIDGIQICPPTAGRDGETYLSVLVALEPLGGDEEDDGLIQIIPRTETSDDL